MTRLTDLYLQRIHRKLDLIAGDEARIKTCGKVMAQAVIDGKQLFVFGAGHGGIVAEEATYRAGGLALFNPVFHSSLMLDTRPLTLTTAFENIEGMGQKIVAATPLGKGDVLLVHSVSGRNPVGIDIASAAKARNATVIAITSLDTAKRVRSRHSSGKLLGDIADHVIDNRCDYGDAAIAVAGMAQKAGPLSTILGVTILNCLSLVVCETMIAQGLEPPVLASVNVDGNQAINHEILHRYRQRIHYL